MHQNLTQGVETDTPESVHLCGWPKSESIDTELNTEMEFILRLVSLGHAARNQASCKLRQPLSEIAFAVTSDLEQDIVIRYKDVIADELNVKEVRLMDVTAEVISYQLKPLPKQLGQKYGSRFPELRKAILQLDPRKASTQFLNGNSVEVTLNGEKFSILPEEVEVIVEAKKGFSTSSEGSYLAALTTEVTHELKLEGLAREFVRRVQNLRKSADLNVNDRIEIQYSSSKIMAEAVENHRVYISEETLAENLKQVQKPSGKFHEEYTFGDEKLVIAITRSRS
jgi:isoleucyl-tRNA synthetase